MLIFFTIAIYEKLTRVISELIFVLYA